LSLLITGSFAKASVNIFAMASAFFSFNGSTGGGRFSPSFHGQGLLLR